MLIVSGLGWLFLKTIRETNAEPYTIDGEDVSGWTLALEDPEFGGPGVLVLQPPVGMPAELFRQIFLRSGLSMAGPCAPFDADRAPERVREGCRGGSFASSDAGNGARGGAGT